MAGKKKTTSSVENKAREDVHKKAKEIIESKEESKTNPLEVNLSPVQRQKLELLASLHDDEPEIYAEKILGRFIADRLYLLK